MLHLRLYYLLWLHLPPGAPTTTCCACACAYTCRGYTCYQAAASVRAWVREHIVYTLQDKP